MLVDEKPKRFRHLRRIVDILPRRSVLRPAPADWRRVLRPEHAL